jgi:hypothetical protein
LLVSLLAALSAAAQLRIAEPPSRQGTGILDVTLAPAEITVGDRVEARLTLVWTGPTPAQTPRFPPWQDAWGDAEVLEAGEVEEVAVAGARRVYHQRLVLTAFATGEVELPPVTVAIEAGGETIEIEGGDAGFAVRSVLPEEPGELEPRPPSPPRRLAADRRFAWTAAGLGALVLLAAWLLARRLRAAADRVAEPPAAEPLPELLHLLRRLDPTDAEPAHTGLSLGLRHFLGRSLDFPAAESTTSEIDRRLHRILAGLDASDDTVLLLRDCDQVKFARAPVPAQVTRQRLRQARDLGYRIDRSRQPAAGAEEAP